MTCEKLIFEAYGADLDDDDDDRRVYVRVPVEYQNIIELNQSMNQEWYRKLRIRHLASLMRMVYISYSYSRWKY